MPDDVEARMLDPEARKELRGLTRETADLVARHLVVTGQTMDDDPQEALAHARAARAMAGRIGIVRQAAGLAAYAAGEWSEALSELRAARRITGRPEHLAVLADCERALGRPERALAYADDPEVAGLPQDERVELVIVLSGARRDRGQHDAAVLVLQDPARRTTAQRPWAPRLWYAFADALLAAGREGEAREWFQRTAGIDVDGATDAGDRLLELDGVVLEDLADDEDDPSGLADAELAAYVAEVFPVPASSSGSSAAAAAPAGPAPAGVASDLSGSGPSDQPVSAPDAGVPAGATVGLTEPGNDVRTEPLAEAESAAGPAVDLSDLPDAAPLADAEPAAGRRGAVTNGLFSAPAADEPVLAARSAAALTPTFAGAPAEDDDEELTLFDDL